MVTVGLTTWSRGMVRPFTRILKLARPFTRTRSVGSRSVRSVLRSEEPTVTVCGVAARRQSRSARSLTVNRSSVASGAAGVAAWTGGATQAKPAPSAAATTQPRIVARILKLLVM
jgi:hypothetical protein